MAEATMGIEAFIWSYTDGEPSSLAFFEVREAFAPFVTGWDGECGVLHLAFDSDPCDVFCGKDSHQTNLVKSLTISRPLRHPDLWRCVLKVMAMGHTLLFFSDDTTPLLLDPDSSFHFPPDLLESLGTPVIIATPDDIARLHEG